MTGGASSRSGPPSVPAASRIVKQLLLESEALVAIGAAGGMILAAWMNRRGPPRTGAVRRRRAPLRLGRLQVTVVVTRPRLPAP